jgi:hypothetical protein
MKLSSFKDIEAPIDWLFAQVADFPAYERQAMRRGADVKRTDPRPGLGAAWEAQFHFRGKDRRLTAQIAEFDPPNGLRLTAVSAGIDVDTTVDLVALSRSRTRLTVGIALSAKTLGTRLLLQSLRLTQGNISRQFDARIAAFARDLQDRHQRRAAG